MMTTARTEGNGDGGGVRLVESGTLVDRALDFLGTGPADSETLAREVFGLRPAKNPIADRIAVTLLGADPRVQRLWDGRWGLVQVQWGSPKLVDCPFAVVDVETTGSSPGRGDRIIEIAIVAVTMRTLDLAFHSLVDPARRVPRGVSSLTRISQAMVDGQPAFEDISGEVMRVLSGRIFVAHNVRFDWLFVAREIRRARSLTLDGPRLCTVDLTRRFVPGLKSRSLDSVSEYFGIEIGDRHRALGDAMGTARVLQRLLELAQDRGAVTLDDLRRIGRRQKKRKKKSALPRTIDEL